MLQKPHLNPSPRQTPKSAITLTPFIDAQRFPHIFESILQLSSRDGLRAMRGVNSALRLRFDTSLCSHLAVYTVYKEGKCCVGFHTMVESTCGDDGGLHPYPLPGFAFYPACTNTAKTPLHLSTFHLDFTYGRVSRRRLMPELCSSGNDAYGDRAEKWCSAATVNTRVLEIDGNALPGLERLYDPSGALSNVHTVRFTPGYEVLRAHALPVPSRHLIVAYSLVNFDPDDRYDSGAAAHFIPTFSAQVERLTVQISHVPRCHHHGTTISPPAFQPGSRLQDIVLVLRSDPACGVPNFHTAVPHPQEFGVLAGIMRTTLPHLGRVRLTIVGLSPAAGPMIGHSDALAGWSIDGSGTHETGDWEKEKTNIKTTLLANIRRALGAVRHPGSGDERGELWTEEQIRSAIANVRFATKAEWRAETDRWDTELPARV